MSPVERAVIWRKLERITTNLRLLESVREIDLAAYRADVFRRKAVERLLQEIVDAAVDANAHLLVETGRPAPDDLHASFVALGEMGVLDPQFASAITPSAGLRNRLVHEYDQVDEGLVLAAVGTALEQYPIYIACLEKFLSSLL